MPFKFRCIVLIFLTITIPHLVLCQLSNGSDSFPGFLEFSNNSPSKSILDNVSAKEEKCLKTARYVGIAGGSFMGIAQIYWSATGMSGVHGPVWKNVVTGLPSSIIGGYAGSKMTVWMTQKLLNEKPSPVNAVWKGALYGAIDGAVTFTSEMMPLLIIGNYMKTIEFNDLDADWVLLQLIGASIAGGMAYGGTFGIIAGTIYGPGISIYMEF